MRLIDADALYKTVCDLRCGCEPDKCEYEYDNEKYCEIAQFIELAPTIEAIPLKPIAEWLAGYAAPPRDIMRAFFQSGGEITHESLTVAWEQTLRGIDWEDYRDVS